jgi:hypothetical protein
MQELLVVDLEDPVDHLWRQEQSCLDGEFSLAVFGEEVLKGLAEEIHDHDVVFPLGGVGVDFWDADVVGFVF